MAGQTIRITKGDHAALAELSRTLGKSMTATLSDAVNALKRQELLKRTNEAYAALKSKPDAWKDEQEERKAWESTLSDGLEKG